MTPLPRTDRRVLIFVTGATCAGKTTFFDWVRTAVPTVGLVEVGKIFRAKYPPSHFAGHSNPAHTQEEAWSIFEAEVARCVCEEAQFILVDGQPRTLDQVDRIEARSRTLNDEQHVFLHLWAPLKVRAERALLRDGDDPERFKLTEARLTGDIGRNYDVLSRVLWLGGRVVGCDTSAPTYRPEEALLRAAWAIR